ncbi:hypothetical protein J5N97_013706 [Dioscorea zingiberensis]|uniref:Uncharacterized protein n=1 Tax=Dioscorea zingiberensis TaxID=325984 RepID=A0A9D5CSK8_9LILI|nr:hypothetical protein J5N97_013706 [Dioscorea zingiberensis]
MLPAVMLLDPGEVSKSTRWVVVHTVPLRADIHPPPHLSANRPLSKLPWQVVPAAVELEVPGPGRTPLLHISRINRDYQGNEIYENRVPGFPKQFLLLLDLRFAVAPAVVAPVAAAVLVAKLSAAAGDRSSRFSPIK